MGTSGPLTERMGPSKATARCTGRSMIFTEPSSVGTIVRRPPRWNRLRLARETTYRLRDRKARTGLTPNLLCRFGFCLSLAEPQIPDPGAYDETGQEFNRSTLV